VPYVAGDFWRICDACGFQYRSSETRKRWDGAWVCIPDWESRHPQDHVRGRGDRQRVPEPRPEPADVFVAGTPSPVVTADGENVFTLDNEMVVI
jgi:hypothetical protein